MRRNNGSGRRSSASIPPHPLGIRPTGDGWGRKPGCRPNLGPLLRPLTDSVHVMILSHLSARDLLSIGETCRAMYVLSSDEETWKALTFGWLADHPDVTLRTRTRWKMTHLDQLGHAPSTTPLSVAGFYSDELYASHLCAHAPLQRRWLLRETVDRRSQLSVSDFISRYEETNLPVVLTDGAKDWPALRKWSVQRLRSVLGDSRVHAGGIHFLMKDYIEYAESHSREELPLYVFDKHFCESIPSMEHDFCVPQYFQDDLFQVLGSDRPDYRWLIMGPARSGSSFHQDPNRTSAWNACVQGSKRWILFPPGRPPPGVHPSEDGSSVAAPVSVIEWYRSFYDGCEGALEATVSAGEVMFVPSGWWHCVLNLSFSVAVTQNFVSWSNLRAVSRFLKHQTHNVSGVPVDKRNSLGGQFLTALEKRFPGSNQVKACVESNEGDERSSSCSWKQIKGSACEEKSGFTFGFSV
jgi:hypothetical protein